MANLSYKNDEQEDERLNPVSTARNLQTAEESNGYTNSGIDQAEAFANDPANATKQQEENPNGINYTGGSSGPTKEKTSFNFRGQLKKKGPMGAIIALLLGGGGGLIMLFSPGLAVVQIKELMTEDLNDQLAAMDIRTSHVFKAKLNDMKSGALCTGISPAKCKFKGMSERQVKKFKAAGIDVEVSGEKTITGKQKVTRISLKDSGGKTIVIDNPAKINQHLGDRVVQNAFRRAFNPKFAGFYDKASASVFAKYRTSKANKLSGKTTEEFDKNINDSVDGKTGTLEARIVNDGTTNEEKEQAKKEQADLTSQEERIKGNVGGVGGVFSSVGKGLGVLGAADTKCTVQSTARAVSAGAKVLRAAQLVGYAMVFLNFADQVKAGTATADQAEYVGDKLTAVDTNKKIVDENSRYDSSGQAQEVDNPYYGSNAFDSAGYKVAAYNDAPTLSSRDLQYTLGGALSGSLATILNKIGNTATSDGTCKVVQNPVVRGLSLGGGILLGIGSGGTSIAISVGASVGIAAILPLLESYLSDMIAGRTVSSKTQGVDAGDAIFSGTAALQSDVAASRGMKPLNKDEIKAYQAYSSDIKNQYIAMETEDAKKTPFDVYSQYSFLGSFARKLLPSVSNSSSNTSQALSSVGSIVNAAPASLFPTAKAVGTFNSERFNRCEDEAYDKIGIDADVFCNVRFGMSEKELSMETDPVVDAMLAGRYVDANGIPQGEYAEWLQECTQRTNGWGEGDEGTNENDGAECMKTGDKYSYFRVYTMDSTILEAMEYEGLTTGPDLDVMTYNVRKDELTDSSKRNGPIAAIIQERQPAIIGFQEMQQVQATAISKALPDYSYTNSGLGGTRRIFWKTSMFSKVDDGTWHSTKDAGSDTMPWVKLQASSGKILYVFDVHTEPASNPGAAESQARDAKHLLENVIPKATKNDGNPILVIGDMNSGYPGHAGDGTTSFYSTFTKNNTFDLSFNEAAIKINDDCSTGHDFGDQRCGIKNARHIDHIYVSTNANATIKSWENIANEVTSNASDHNPVLVKMSIPGITATMASETVTGGFAWPLGESHYKRNPGLYKRPHASTGTAWGGDNMGTSNKGAGIAIDIGTATGTPVYAMFGGVVTSTSLCGANDGIAIKSNLGGGTVGVAYMHGKNKKFKTGDTVQAGQQIMEVGMIGCNVFGAHLHIGVAYNGKYVCPQDIFLAQGQSLNFGTLVQKAAPPCGR